MRALSHTAAMERQTERGELDSQGMTFTPERERPEMNGAARIMLPARDTHYAPEFTGAVAGTQARTADSDQHAQMENEAELLRQHKNKLETRLQALEKHNLQLEQQLGKIRILLAQQQINVPPVFDPAGAGMLAYQGGPIPNYTMGYAGPLVGPTQSTRLPNGTIGYSQASFYAQTQPAHVYARTFQAELAGTSGSLVGSSLAGRQAAIRPGSGNIERPTDRHLGSAGVGKYSQAEERRREEGMRMQQTGAADRDVELEGRRRGDRSGGTPTPAAAAAFSNPSLRMVGQLFAMADDVGKAMGDLAAALTDDEA